jgi:hypothetical protein
MAYVPAFDRDHPEIYRGDKCMLVQAFQQFKEV